MTTGRFHGAFTALVTPFKNGKIDEEAYREFIEWQIEQGIDGLVPCGTTGESATMTHDEHEAAIRICVEQVNKRVPVIAGTGSNNTAHAVMMSKGAADLGADALLVVTPYYNKTSQAGLIASYTAVADAIYLSRICHKVSIIVRRDVLRATAIYNIKLREFDNVEIIWNTTVEEVIGSDFVVTGIKVKNAITGEEHTIDCAALFVAIGTVPNVEFLGDAVERDATGHIVTNSVGETSVPGVYAAGDIRSKKLRQITTAVADGANAAEDAAEYLIQHE